MESITIIPAAALAEGCSASLSTLFMDSGTDSSGARWTRTDYQLSATSASGWRFAGFSWKQRRKEDGNLSSNVVKEWGPTSPIDNPFHDADASSGSPRTLSDWFIDYRGTEFEQYWTTVTWTCYDFVATFERLSNSVNVISQPSPAGTYAAGCRVSGDGTVTGYVNSRANFTLVASPAAGYHFVRWECKSDNGSPSLVGTTWAANPLSLSFVIKESGRQI